MQIINCCIISNRKTFDNLSSMENYRHNRINRENDAYVCI